MHSFCNWCGLPRLWGRVEAGEVRGPPVPVRGSGGRGKDDENDGVVDSVQVVSAAEELAVIWTVAYYILLFGGAYGFAKGLWTLTEASNALVSFGEQT